MIRLFGVSIPTPVVALVLSDLVLITACYVSAAYFSFDITTDPWFYFRYEYGWAQLLIAVAVIQIGLYFMDMYDGLAVRSRMLLLQQLSLLLGSSFLIQALLSYSEVFVLTLPQWTMVYGSAFVLLLIPLSRVIVFSSFVNRALPNQKILFVGYSPGLAETAAELTQRPELGFTPIGQISTAAEKALKEIPCLGSPQQLRDVVAASNPDRVVVSNVDMDQTLVETLLDLRVGGLHIEPVGTFYETVFGRVSVRDLQPKHMLASNDLAPRPFIVGLQTIYSFVLSLIGFLITLPIMLLVFLAVRLTSAGPGLYSQKRVGLHGKPFYLYKFRSMYVDAEARSGPIWATANDPRVTPVGWWLRKLRLDELPQFFNVLRGDMVLVGPRPERPEFCSVLNEKIPFFNQRHSVKPGVTGWAQINHKYAETIEDTVTKLEYDLYYVKHMAPALDAYVIFHTVKVMLLFRGAQ